MIKAERVAPVAVLATWLVACTGTIEGESMPGGGPGGSESPGRDGAPMGQQPSGSGEGSPGQAPGPSAACKSGAPRAPLRRLTPYEYDNTIRDLLGDETSPGQALPSDEIGNGFGNDADALSVSSLLAEQYGKVAEGVARRATSTPERLAKLASCARGVTAEAESACARDIIERFLPRAYRRPLEAGEVDALLALQRTTRASAPDFATSIAAVIEAVLQSPDFLYRIELGVPDPKQPTRRRPSGHEMATRLSYLFWGTMPDAGLSAAAESGALLTDEGVLAQARRLLDDPRSRAVVRYFFDHFLPIGALSHLERDAKRFPTFSASIGTLLREETQRFLAHELFESPGTWPGAFTATYTFVNEALARYYGIGGVQGEAFRKVDVDTRRRLGFLTQAGVMAGTTHSNETSPVVRGSYVVQKLMCRTIPLPTGDILDEVKPPDPYSGKTARDRYKQHSADPACVASHLQMDPIGLALENYDPVGLWRDQENGVTIDASGSVPGTQGTVAGPTELVRKIAGTDEAKSCFVHNWANFAYGRILGEADECTRTSLERSFQQSGYDVRRLLLALTQSELFLSLPPVKE